MRTCALDASEESRGAIWHSLPPAGTEAEKVTMLV
jgi:hypothetical protein